MSTITTRRRYRDLLQGLGRGPGRHIVAGWPLSADAWDGQMVFLAQHGSAPSHHDRRGHGRSSQSSAGNNMDTYADDLAPSESEDAYQTPTTCQGRSVTSARGSADARQRPRDPGQSSPRLYATS